MKFYLEPRSIDNKLRDITVITSTGEFFGSKILLRSVFPFFEGFEEDIIEVETINSFGLDLLKLSHGDIRELNKDVHLNSNSKIIQYILQADYLLVSVKFIYELCNKLLSNDNEIKDILENYYRLYRYTRYRNYSSVKQFGTNIYDSVNENLETQVVNYFIYTNQVPNIEVLKYLSAIAIRKLNEHFKTNMTGLKYDLIDYFSEEKRRYLSEEYRKDIISKDIIKLSNYDSLEDAKIYSCSSVSLHTLKKISRKKEPWERKDNFFNDPPVGLIELLTKNGIEFLVRSSMDSLIITDENYEFFDLKDFRYEIDKNYNFSRIPLSKISDEAEEIELTRFVYDIPDNFRIGDYDVPLRKILIENLNNQEISVDIPIEILKSLKFFVAHLRTKM